MKEVAKRWSVITLLVIVGVVTRWIPHPPNFSAIMAIALFAGFVLPIRVALVIPIVSMLAGDLLGAFYDHLLLQPHDLMWVVYLSLLPMVFIGRQLPELSRKPRTWLNWGMSGLIASIIFFVTTNLAVWWTSTLYLPHTQESFVSCFLLAIPFFHNSVLATWLYLGVFEAAHRFQPALFPVQVKG